jgi:hypothetical protein
MPDVQHYLSHISAYEREYKEWEGRGEKILREYRDDKRKKGDAGSKFNVLWSNVQTLKAATFSRMPQPDVSRRFKDDDAVGRVAALMLERALEFEVHHYKDFGASLRQCVYDRFLPGRGVAWVRYEPTFKQVQGGAPEDGPTLTEDVDSESQVSEELDFECAPVDYVHWKDFGHNVARTWEEVSLVWRRVYLTRKKLQEMGEDFAKLPLDSMPDEKGGGKASAEGNAVQKCALVYEMWDKDTGNCVFVSKSTNCIIKETPDPLGLEEFFPCPPPLYATLTTDSLVPLPDFTLYQDQARELNTLADRIDGLVQALQVKGCYDSATPELARLFTEGTSGTLIPVKNWAAFAEKKGLDGSINLVELAPIAQALREAYMAFEQIKGQIYELTGISDIIRGDTAASETATAQKIKNNYASMRLKTYQDEVERFASRLLQLKAQIICRHFDEDTICKISGCDQLSGEDQAHIPQALELLKDNVTRMFRIEVSTDSMVFQDEQQDKQDANEFLTAVSGFLEKAVNAPPVLAPLLAELLKFGVRSYRVGKNVEGAIEQAADQLKEQAKKQAENPTPHPDQIKAQATQQAAQTKVQGDIQQTQMELQAKQQSDQADAQAKVAIEQAKASAGAQMEQQRMQHEQAMQAMQQQHEQAMAQFQSSQDAVMGRMEQNMQLMLQAMKGSVAVEVAEMGAETTLQTAQISAAKQGDGE